MDKYKIISFPSFERELTRVYEYIKYLSGSKKIADKFQYTIKDYISKLDLFPERYARILISEKQKRNLRKIPIKKYAVIYEVDNIKKKFISYIYFIQVKTI